MWRSAEYAKGSGGGGGGQGGEGASGRSINGSSRMPGREELGLALGKRVFLPGWHRLYTVSK